MAYKIQNIRRGWGGMEGEVRSAMVSFITKAEGHQREENY